MNSIIGLKVREINKAIHFSSLKVKRRYLFDVIRVHLYTPNKLNLNRTNRDETDVCDSRTIAVRLIILMYEMNVPVPTAFFYQ